MSPLFYLATPLPLAVMIIAVIALRLMRSVSGLKWLVIGWAALTGFGIWWLNYDAAQASARGVLVVDAGFVNSFNCALFGVVGIVVGLVVWLNLKSKISSKGK